MIYPVAVNYNPIYINELMDASSYAPSSSQKWFLEEQIEETNKVFFIDDSFQQAPADTISTNIEISDYRALRHNSCNISHRSAFIEKMVTCFDKYGIVQYKYKPVWANYLPAPERPFHESKQLSLASERNISAISLLKGWLDENDENEIAEQQKSLADTKSNLDVLRATQRKLFP